MWGVLLGEAVSIFSSSDSTCQIFHYPILILGYILLWHYRSKAPSFIGSDSTTLFLVLQKILFKKIFLRIFSDNYKAQLDRMRSH